MGDRAFFIYTTKQKTGSEQESDEVPDWRGFRDFVLSGEFDSSSVRSADAGSAEGIAETGRDPQSLFATDPDFGGVVEA